MMEHTETMEHAEIERDDVVERYVTGKLTPEDEERFEEHYVDCLECIRAVEDAERLHRGLTLMAAEDLAARRTVLAAAAALLRSRPGALLAGLVLVIALLPAGLAWRQAGRLGDELDAARRELADEHRPRVNTPVLALEPVRAGEPSVQEISLAPEPEWIVLLVELGDDAEASYRATLTRADGTSVWEASGLLPSYLGAVSLSLHSSSIPPGEYELRLEGATGRHAFPLRVTRRR